MGLPWGCSFRPLVVHSDGWPLSVLQCLIEYTLAVVAVVLNGHSFTCIWSSRRSSALSGECKKWMAIIICVITRGDTEHNEWIEGICLGGNCYLKFLILFIRGRVDLSVPLIGTLSFLVGLSVFSPVQIYLQWTSLSWLVITTNKQSSLIKLLCWSEQSLSSI